MSIDFRLSACKIREKISVFRFISSFSLFHPFFSYTFTPVERYFFCSNLQRLARRESQGRKVSRRRGGNPKAGKSLDGIEKDSQAAKSSRRHREGFASREKLSTPSRRIRKSRKALDAVEKDSQAAKVSRCRREGFARYKLMNI